MPQALPTDNPYADAYATLDRVAGTGVDDIIHLPGRVPVTPAMRAEYSLAQREGRAPALSAAEIDAVRAFWARLFRMQASEVPRWKQETNKLLTQLDNIEDQVSTVQWLAGMLLKKTPLAPLANLRAVEHTQRALNGATDLLSMSPAGRARKAIHERKRREQRLDKLRGGGALQRGRAWLETNYAHLLEGAQATDTWWGVGVSLGPIMGAIDEGYWGIARWANEGYLEMADLVRPGSSDAFKEWANEADKRIYEFIMKPLREIDWTGSSDDITPHLERARRAYDALGDWFSRGKLTAVGWELQEPQHGPTTD